MTTASPSSRWPVVIGLLGLLALIVVGGYAAFYPGRPVPPPHRPPADPPDLAEQVHNFCGGACHAYPPADSFPREHWRAEVERGFGFFERSGLPLKPPPLESVVRYYQGRAPEDYTAPTWPKPSRPLALRFERHSYPGPEAKDRVAVSHVSLVRLPAPGRPAPRAKTPHEPHDILACDMHNNRVMLLRPYEPRPEWKVLAKVPHPSHAEVIDLDGDGIKDLLVACLGSFGPTDQRCGSVVWLRGNSDGTFTPFTLLDKVGRVADVQAADFRGTGKLDLVVAVFGWQATGELLFLENQTTQWKEPRFVPRVLDPRHGTIHVPVADLNGDGKLDFVALISQEHETVVAFLNEGGGKFRQQTLYTAPHPGYGSSGIQLVDLDGDRLLDVLYTNGDSLDKPYLYKPYHGVRWLRNQGGLRFEHQELTPMYGVHRAVAADLHGRGKHDIVAVSFLPAEHFPDRGKHNPDAIIVLENLTGAGRKVDGSRLRFDRHSLLAGECDHVSCVVGDVFGTGRQDIVVGNFRTHNIEAPVTIWKNVSGTSPP